MERVECKTTRTIHPPSIPCSVSVSPSPRHPHSQASKQASKQANKQTSKQANHLETNRALSLPFLCESQQNPGPSKDYGVEASSRQSEGGALSRPVDYKKVTSALRVTATRQRSETQTQEFVTNQTNKQIDRTIELSAPCRAPSRMAATDRAARRPPTPTTTATTDPRQQHRHQRPIPTPICAGTGTGTETPTI